MKPARIVVIDDPVPYNNRHAVRHDGGATRFGIGADGHYGAGVMSELDLVKLGTAIHSLMAADGLCFAWSTCPNADMHFRIMFSRGFIYTTRAFEWVKTNADGTPFFGTGRYTASNVEDLNLWRISKLPLWFPNTGYTPRQPQLQPHPRKDGKIIHSRKPEVFQDEIEKWLGPHLEGHSMVELFATRYRPGWHCLGHSLSGRDIKDDMADLAKRMYRDG